MSSGTTMASSTGRSSCTIDEMRQLHQHARAQAEAKRTELRLVLASRYRELVGSSDDVIKMKERAQELHQLVHALPALVNKWQTTSTTSNSNKFVSEESKQHTESNEVESNAAFPLVNAEASSSILELHVLQWRRELTRGPRLVHRALDASDVFEATTTLLSLLRLIAQCSHEYPLATRALHLGTNSSMTLSTPLDVRLRNDPVLQMQIRMVYLQVQTLPPKILHLTHQELCHPAVLYSSFTQRLLSYLPSSSTPMDRFLPESADGFHFAATQSSAAAMATWYLLAAVMKIEPSTNGLMSSIDVTTSASELLLDQYFDSKATLMGSLLERLHSSSFSSSSALSPDTTTNDNSTDIIDQIILVLQYDILLHPFLIFCARRFPDESISKATFSSRTSMKYPSLSPEIFVSSSSSASVCSQIMAILPTFDPMSVRLRVTKFFMAHLPLIRTKVKSVLIKIAGTTASALGSIRQSLFDQTDGQDRIACLEHDLNGNLPLITSDVIGEVPHQVLGTKFSWFDVVDQLVDMSQLHQNHGLSNINSTSSLSAATRTSTLSPSHDFDVSPDKRSQTRERGFSLWAELFSHTFSSLVHSLLSTAFESVHTNVIASLQSSLAMAPPLSSILPHEAYRNTLRIATDLDQALLKVRDDAHELLVHAEEREESERRLRQSLYVQTCEIMVRLLYELRRMASTTPSPSQSHDSRHHDVGHDAVKELIIGRLCYHMKFRLTTLPQLLDASSSPAVLLNSSGMINYIDLQSAFDLADDNGDGFITLDEAMAAVDSAFSGTSFHGSEIIKETLAVDITSDSSDTKDNAGHRCWNVTLNELALMTARGLRHAHSGAESALGTVQRSLDYIVDGCFRRWADGALSSAAQLLQSSLLSFVSVGHESSDEEWLRLFLSSDQFAGHLKNAPAVLKASPFLVGFLLSTCSILNRTTCPSDSLPQYSSHISMLSLGIEHTPRNGIATLTNTIRAALMRCSLNILASYYSNAIDSVTGTGSKFCRSASEQLVCDLFMLKNAFGASSTFLDGNGDDLIILSRLTQRCQHLSSPGSQAAMDAAHEQIFQNANLLLLPLFGRIISHSNDSTVSNERFPTESRAFSVNGTQSGSLFHMPLPSSRRFILLPIQTDHSLADLHIRGRFVGEKNDTTTHQGTSSGVIGTGLGFFSNMLKKK